MFTQVQQSWHSKPLKFVDFNFYIIVMYYEWVGKSMKPYIVLYQSKNQTIENKTFRCNSGFFLLWFNIQIHYVCEFTSHEKYVFCHFSERHWILRQGVAKKGKKYIQQWTSPGRLDAQLTLCGGIYCLFVLSMDFISCQPSGA